MKTEGTKKFFVLSVQVIYMYVSAPCSEACFESLYYEDMVNIFVDMPKKYALQINNVLNMNYEEIMTYISFPMLIGYIIPNYFCVHLKPN